MRASCSPVVWGRPDTHTKDICTASALSTIATPRTSGTGVAPWARPGTADREPLAVRAAYQVSWCGSCGVLHATRGAGALCVRPAHHEFAPLSADQLGCLQVSNRQRSNELLLEGQVVRT